MKVAAACGAVSRVAALANPGQFPQIHPLTFFGGALVLLAVYGTVLSGVGKSTLPLWTMAAVFIAATVSSIAGFAFSAICGAMLFHLLGDPVYVVNVMMICSVGGQALMVWAMRRDIIWRSVWVFLVGAGIGLPFGLYVLLHSRPATYTAIIGWLLVAYALFMIFRRPLTIRRQHPLLDAAAGVLGGLTGGAIAFPGALVTIWCSFKGWSKERQRGVYQPFILIVQIAAVAAIALSHAGGVVERPFDFSGIVYLPAMLFGSWCGLTLFRRLNDRQFALMVNALLIVSGASFLV
jgi:uncharacterized membrane protein YfcA